MPLHLHIRLCHDKKCRPVNRLFQFSSLVLNGIAMVVVLVAIGIIWLVLQ
jgi:hypothetical protein